jgi:hypothetical protein
MSVTSAHKSFYVIEVRDHLTKFYHLPGELPVRTQEDVGRIRERGYNISRGLEAMQWVVDHRPEFVHAAAYRRFLLKWPMIAEAKEAILQNQFRQALIRLDAMVTID